MILFRCFVHAALFLSLLNIILAKKCADDDEECHEKAKYLQGNLFYLCAITYWRTKCIY